MNDKLIRFSINNTNLTRLSIIGAELQIGINHIGDFNIRIKIDKQDNKYMITQQFSRIETDNISRLNEYINVCIDNMIDKLVHDKGGNLNE